MSKHDPLLTCQARSSRCDVANLRRQQSKTAGARAQLVDRMQSYTNNHPERTIVKSFLSPPARVALAQRRRSTANDTGVT
jgi:hypothetical protein